jgi:DNA mismatch repair protein MutS2
VDIVDRAAEILDAGRTESGRIISSLSRRQKEQEHEESSLRQRLSDIVEREAELEADLVALREREKQQHQQASQELRRFLTDSRRDVEFAIREMKTLTRAVSASASDLGVDEAAAAARAAPEVAIERLKVEQEAISALDTEAGTNSMVDGTVLSPGIRVRIRRTGVIGKVVRQHRPDRYADRYVVQTDTVRGQFRAAELELITGDEPTFSAPGTRIELITQSEPVLELHVRRMRVEEALQEVERQLDAAVIRGWSQFSIVHGRGGGILRQEVRRYLKNSPAVSDVQDAPANEGGYGKTIVRLIP